MKTKLAFLTTVALVLFLFSCASPKIMSVNTTIQPATLDLGSLPRDQYVVIGQVSGEGYITAKTTDIEKQAKSRALIEPSYYSVDIQGDTDRYGFLGNEVNTNMTVIEKAIAIATYKMIQAAQYNGADTVVYVTTTTKILPKSYSAFSSESIISAKVTGLAIKLKPDAGIQIKIPEPEESIIKQVEQEKEVEKASKGTDTAGETNLPSDATDTSEKEILATDEK